MAGNSMASLLQWLDGKSKTLGWDTIIWLDREKLNRFLLQEYITRFDSGHYLRPITDSEDTVTSETEYLYDYTLDYPRLSFVSTEDENQVLESKMALTMKVVGGSHITLKQSQGVKRAIRVDSIDPLDGPRVRMSLDLPNVAGTVGQDGRVNLDLSKGYDFLLSYGQTEFMNDKMGKLFKRKFEEIDVEDRVYPLSVLAPGINPFMRPDRFLMRTQQVNEQARNPRAAEFEDGALVVFVAMSGSQLGRTPTTGSDFRYLIPDDAGKDFSAAILYSREIITYAPIANQVFGSLAGVNYRVDRDADSGNVTQIIATSGSYTVPRRTISEPGNPSDPSAYPAFTLNVEPFTYSYAAAYDPLKIKFGNDGTFEIHFSIIGDADCRFANPGTEACTVKCDIRFSTWLRVQLSDVGSGVKLGYPGGPNSFFPDTHRTRPERFPQPFSNESGLAWSNLKSKLVGVSSTGSEGSYAYHFWRTTWDNWRQVIEQMQFYKTLNLPFGHAIDARPYDMRLPRDLVIFAKVDPTTTTFSIAPTEFVLGAGDNHTFRTEPSVTGVVWSVENIMGENAPKGDITTGGKYTAPTAAQIDGYYRRVKVTATKGNYKSSALVSVVIRDITINPLIQVCEPEQSLKIWAGALGTGTLTFRTMDSSFGGTVVPNLTDPERRNEHIYTAGPKKAGVIFHIEEIQVTNQLTGRSQITRVLVEHRGALLAVNIVGSAGLPANQLKFEAVLIEEQGPVAGVKWQVLAGSGSIDADTAIYTVDPAGSHRYAVVMASFAFPGLGDFYGYFILPLPLTEFPAVMQVLTH
ncbi:hypothetical protein [Pseudomonas sp. MWU13-2100]|uniref:hypothetical protein n=1 Tax=Pseudomonas sp. MWU13-2100 TaxID=2935075 RepID=UPI00200F73AE|nr:hypothetical protein [Pseudomonas sp. MWU13-2100]